MGQIKAKTMIEKLGFLDSDRKDPNHKKIQEWLFENTEKVLEDILKVEKIITIHNDLEFLVQSGNYVVGFVDLRFEYKIENQESEYSLLAIFEVKASIPDFGELLRQMNFYKKYLGTSRYGQKVLYIVVSPDDKYQKILESQGLYFYKYKDETKLF